VWSYPIERLRGLKVKGDLCDLGVPEGSVTFPDEAVAQPGGFAVASEGDDVGRGGEAVLITHPLGQLFGGV